MVRQNAWPWCWSGEQPLALNLQTPKKMADKMQEWEREEIELDDADGKNVDVMLRYMYNINWLENKQEEQDDKTWSQLDKLADVYLTARKYEVDGLMAMAVEQMKKILKGDTGELAEPKYLSEYDLDEYHLTEVLRLVWLNTSTEDKDVRSKLAYFCGRHFEELIKEGPFVETVLDIPDLKIWVCLARVLEVDRKDAQNDGGQGEVDAGNE